MVTFDWVYLVTSLVISLFYGLFAVLIFFGRHHYQALPLVKKIREALFNFSGAAIGFTVFYYLIRKALFSVSEKQYNLINLTDVLLLIVAIIGIFGLLPWTMHTIAGKIDEILSRSTKSK